MQLGVVVAEPERHTVRLTAHTAEIARRHVASWHREADVGCLARLAGLACRLAGTKADREVGAVRDRSGGRCNRALKDLETFLAGGAHSLTSAPARYTKVALAVLSGSSTPRQR
jgi:hypothetical protein